MITRKKVKVRVRIISEVSDLKRKKIAYRIFIEERKNGQREDFVITWWIWDLEKMVFSVFFMIKIVVSFCDEERIRFFLFFFIFFGLGGDYYNGEHCCVWLCIFFCFFFTFLFGFVCALACLRCFWAVRFGWLGGGVLEWT